MAACPGDMAAARLAQAGALACSFAAALACSFAAALACLGAAALATPSVAWAQASAAPPGADAVVPVVLNVVHAPGAASCIAQPELQRAVETRLGRPLASGPVARGADGSTESRRIDVRIFPRPTSDAGSGVGFRAVVSLSGDGKVLGSRELGLDEADCRAFDPVLALAVALAIDPDAVRRSMRPTLTKSAAPPPSVADEARAQENPPTPVVPPEPPTDPADRWGFQVRADLIGGIGLLPDASWGASYGVGVAPPSWWWFELNGTSWVAQTPQVGSVSSRITLQQVGGIFCPRLWDPEGWGFSLCTGPQIGSITAQGQGLDDSKDDAGVTFHLSLGADFSRQIVGPLWANLRASAEVALLRPNVFFTDSEGVRQSIYRASPVAGTGEIGISLRF